MAKGEQIKFYRALKGYSQTELAERIGVSKQTLYKYENNIITNIPSDKIELISSVLEVAPDIIMGWSKEEVSRIPEQVLPFIDPISKLNELGRQKLREDLDDMLSLAKYTSEKNSDVKEA